MSQRQPNSQNCFVCGVANPIGLHLEFYTSNPGEVTAEITLPAQYQGYPGIVHGGIIAAMLDEVAGRTHMGEGASPRFMFTARLDVHYRKNVPTEQPLRLVGRAGESKGRKAMASSAIYGPDGTLLADADAVLVNVPERMIQNSDLEALGWRVYSEEELGRKVG
jgi:acyl-coenzyme A thioesterase PaaI-like protein